MQTDTQKHNETITPNSKEIEILKKCFPQCFSKNCHAELDSASNKNEIPNQVRNDDIFDIEKFKELIAQNDIEIKKEGFTLNFLGKSYARYQANLDSETVIVPDAENDNADNKDSENVYIVGDNLDALQHLKYSYAEKIKCIYIDPPYNTGKDDFVYNDKFGFTAKDLVEKLDITEDEAERIVGMGGKCTHSAWLTFMYPRLVLARELLRDDGVIFISIDDNEQANLKRLCDEVFGEGNFVGLMTIQSNPRGSQNSRNLSYIHEFILMYAKNIDELELHGVEKTDESLAEFKETDESGRKYRLLGLRKRGGAWRKEDRPKMFYPIYVNNLTGECSLTKTNDHTIEVIPKRPTGELSRWTWSIPKFKEEYSLLIGKIVNKGKENESWDIFRKDYIDKDSGEEKDTKLKTIWIEKETNYQNAKNEMKGLFDNSEIFDYPKPIYIVKRLSSILYFDNGDIILDFFSGSGTTAHAVMDLNASDNGNRKFIMVQLNESVRKDSEAEKAGYKTIDEIGRERIRRAAAKIREQNALTAGNLDLGFKTYYLKSMPQNTIDKIKKFDPTAMFGNGDIIKTLGESSLLQTWQIKDGFGFNCTAQKIDLLGYTAYLLEDEKIGKYLYLLNGMEDVAIKELIRKIESMELTVDKIFAYGYSFDFNALTSLTTNLKTLKNRNPLEPIVRY